MPNIVAYFALCSWPLVAIAFFRLMSVPRALVWTIIGAHMLLPSETTIKFHMMPPIDRAVVPAVSALILCMLMAPKEQRPLETLSRSVIVCVLCLAGLVLLTPLLTVMTNTHPIIDGKTFLPGLRLYDGFSLIMHISLQVLPFWIGLRYLNTREGHRVLLEALAIGGFLYTFPALLEIRLSPQLHRWVYGFFPHSFAQHIRDGGFRPVVFLNHGLQVGIFLCISIIAAIVLFREARQEKRRAMIWLMAAVWTTGTLLISKNFGALAIAVVFATAAMILGRRLQLLLAVAVACIVLLYPTLRGSGLIPVDAVYDFARSFSEDRAASLKFRLDNEDALLKRANEKPLAGWGSWGRNAIYDPATGDMTSVTDGIWLFFIGTYGWLGYIGRFGLLTLPILLFAARARSYGPSLVTPGLILVLAAILVDLLPNSALLNYVWLMAGGITGSMIWKQTQPGSPSEITATGASGMPFRPARAPWLMAEQAPAGGRRNRHERSSSR